jgi:O-acetyl-ADP-ribose deacetylase (regulator of RNase III)
MENIKINGRTLELVQGDITKQEVDAIANAANSGLRGGGGVDGAIHRAGGPSIMEECRRIGGCPTGSAVITGAGNLKAKYVIHAVGPVYHGGRSGEPELLAGAYRRSLELTKEHGLSSIVFPSISTGVYGYPVDEAGPIALGVAAEHLRGETTLELIRFVLFDENTYSAYQKALAAIK